MELWNFVWTKAWTSWEEIKAKYTHTKKLIQKLYISYLIDVLQVSYNTKVQFNEVALNSVCLQGDWVVPGTLCCNYKMSMMWLWYNWNSCSLWSYAGSLCTDAECVIRAHFINLTDVLLFYWFQKPKETRLYHGILRIIYCCNYSKRNTYHQCLIHYHKQEVYIVLGWFDICYDL